MDTEIYIFFALSAINFIIFFKMNKGKIKTIKYKLCIVYFYAIFFVCADMIQSMRAGEIAFELSTIVFVGVMIAANIIFIGMKE